MSELRQDPLSGRWVVIAKSRGERPVQWTSPPGRAAFGRCPFCAGHEDDTPPTLASYPPDGPWQVRVVRNKFPAVDASERLEPLDEPQGDELGELESRRAGYGRHEVVIEAREHVEEFVDVPPETAGWTFVAYRDRLIELAADPRLGYALAFKNNGPEAGSSIPHAHSQILATSAVPTAVRIELETSQQWYERRGECLFCRMVERELQQAERVVLETRRFVAFCPFASRFPYEVWFAPRRHESRYEAASVDELQELAELVRALLAALRQAQGDVAFNYVLHTAPLRSRPLDHYHWHWELLPRITTQAGFEWGGGDFINPVPPETAARDLRAALGRSTPAFSVASPGPGRGDCSAQS